MTLIKCQECNKEISDKAVACPKCGCPNKLLQQIEVNSLQVRKLELEKDSENKLFALKKNKRRRNRIRGVLLNPFLWLWGFLSFAALIGIFLPPTPLWQYIIGLPVSLLFVFSSPALLREAWDGDYERLSIRTNTNISKPNYLKKSFSAGHYLLENIQLIEDLTNKEGFYSLLSCYEGSGNSNWHPIDEYIETFLYIDNSIVDYVESLRSKYSKNISVDFVEGIQKDCQEFIAILKNLDQEGLKFQLVLLSQDSWNPAVYSYYRENGYCI